MYRLRNNEQNIFCITLKSARITDATIQNPLKHEDEEKKRYATHDRNLLIKLSVY